MRENKLRKRVLATVLYYDTMDYPLTAFEIWRHLLNFPSSDLTSNCRERDSQISSGNEEESLERVIWEIGECCRAELLDEQQGFYFLCGRNEIVKKRLERDKISVQKIKSLKKVVWWLRFIPFVRMIGATGALAMKNAAADSDWDVLVVLKDGKIWTGRTLVTGFLQLIGKRRHGHKIKDRVCLNHFLTEGALEISTREIEPFFPANEIIFMRPLFDTGLYKKFQLNNNWIRKYKSNFYLNEIESVKTFCDSWFSRWWRTIGERLLDINFLENWLERWQAQKIRSNPKTALSGSYIKFSRRQLVFLPEPQGPEIINAVKQKLEKMLRSSEV